MVTQGTGASGATYLLHTAIFGSALPAQPGVYVLTGRDWLTQSIQCLYVGRAKNLNDRIGDGRRHHHQFARFSRVEKVHFWLEPTSGASRHYVESDLYDSLHPVLNRVRPGGVYNIFADWERV